MSRIGKQPVAIPAGVDVTIGDGEVRVRGPRGELAQVVDPRISVEVADGVVTVTRGDDERESRALHGLYRALIANMVQGVSAGYSRPLEIVGVGYRAAQAGTGLRLQLGFSHDVDFAAPEGITIEVQTPTRLTVSGASKHLVGQTAANIRRLKPPEPYKGKGIRYSDEKIRRKAGKAGQK